MHGVAVLVVEDLHWATEPLLELLGADCAARSKGRCVLVTTSRPDPDREAPDEPDPPVAEQRGGSKSSSTPRSGAPLDAAAGELILRHGEGNPFFLGELLSDLLDRGLLERRNGSWSLPGCRR